MSTNRSDTIYGYWREASEKFDYFMTGLTAALVAYVGQQVDPVPVGLNPQTVELLGLAILLVSLLIGFRRIETNVIVFQLMSRRLHREEGRGSLLSAAEGGGPVFNASTGDVVSPHEVHYQAEALRIERDVIAEKLDMHADRSGKYYTWRNRTLVIGFLVLVISRVIPAYM